MVHTSSECSNQPEIKNTKDNADFKQSTVTIKYTDVSCSSSTITMIYKSQASTIERTYINDVLSQELELKLAT